MPRLSLLLVLLIASSASASDLPPGAVLRLGDDRFRAGGGVYHLALSPDGKQFATTRTTGNGLMAVAVWDAETGRPVRSREVNSELFKGLAWGEDGGFAVARRADPGPKDGIGKLFPDDFRVWNFSDPKAAAPPVLPVSLGFEFSGFVLAERPKGGTEYTDFVFSADGRRVAAAWKSAGGKHAVHVYELKPANIAAKLTRVGTIDLGTESAYNVCISADGKTLATFRRLANPQPRKLPDQLTATLWDVTTGVPTKPVRVPSGNRLILTPDGRSLVHDTAEEESWGFDLIDLTSGQRRKLIRWPYAVPPEMAGVPDDAGGFAFLPSGRVLAVAIDGKTVVIDLTTGKELGRLEGHAGTPVAVLVSADGTRIATADAFGLVRLWDAKTLRSLSDAPGHRAPVEYAELSPDGKRLVTWAGDETVRAWDMRTGKELRAFTGAVGLRGARAFLYDQPTFTPDGAAVLFSTKDRLIARDILTGLEVPLPEDMAKLKPRFAVVSPDGKAVLTWAGDGGLLTACEVWDWPSGKKRFEVDGIHEPRMPGFAPDGSVVFIDATSPKRWDAKTGKELPPAWKDDRTNAIDPLLSLRPNPRWLLHDVYDDPRVIETGTDKRVPRARLRHSGRDGDEWHGGWKIALSPCHRQFAFSLELETTGVYLHEAVTGETRLTLRGHRGQVRVLGFTPDGTKLLTAGGDHTVLVWDMRLQSVPLTAAVKQEKSAAKLWTTLATGKADAAYLAMARLATEPDTAVKMARMRLKPAAKGDDETDASKLADARAIELLESLDTDESRKLLQELTGGLPSAFRTQEAKRALERNKK